MLVVEYEYACNYFCCYKNYIVYNNFYYAFICVFTENHIYQVIACSELHAHLCPQHNVWCQVANPRRACAGGLRYLSCVCVCVSVC